MKSSSLLWLLVVIVQDQVFESKKRILEGPYVTLLALPVAQAVVNALNTNAIVAYRENRALEDVWPLIARVMVSEHYRFIDSMPKMMTIQTQICNPQPSKTGCICGRVNCAQLTFYRRRSCHAVHDLLVAYLPLWQFSIKLESRDVCCTR